MPRPRPASSQVCVVCRRVADARVRPLWSAATAGSLAREARTGEEEEGEVEQHHHQQQQHGHVVRCHWYRGWRSKPRRSRVLSTWTCTMEMERLEESEESRSSVRNGSSSRANPWQARHPGHTEGGVDGGGSAPPWCHSTTSISTTADRVTMEQQVRQSSCRQADTPGAAAAAAAAAGERVRGQPADMLARSARAVRRGPAGLDHVRRAQRAHVDVHHPGARAAGRGALPAHASGRRRARRPRADGVRGRAGPGRQVHADVLSLLSSRKPPPQQQQPSLVVGNCLVSVYAKCGSLDDARRVFEALPDRDTVTWNAMMSGYSRAGRGEDTLALYDRMTATTTTGVVHDGGTVVCVPQACAGLGTPAALALGTPAALALGRRLHAQVGDEAAGSTPAAAAAVVGTALVDGHVRQVRQPGRGVGRVPEDAGQDGGDVDGHGGGAGTGRARRGHSGGVRGLQRGGHCGAKCYHVRVSVPCVRRRWGVAARSTGPCRRHPKCRRRGAAERGCRRLPGGYVRQVRGRGGGAPGAGRVAVSEGGGGGLDGHGGGLRQVRHGRRVARPVLAHDERDDANMVRPPRCRRRRRLCHVLVRPAGVREHRCAGTRAPRARARPAAAGQQQHGAALPGGSHRAHRHVRQVRRHAGRAIRLPQPPRSARGGGPSSRLDGHD